MFRVLAPLMGMISRKNLRATAAALQAYLESRGVISGPTHLLVLTHYASLTTLESGKRFVIRTISSSFVLGALVWFAETKGKHLGWAA